MEKKESIFLTVAEAKKAICTDFRQYGPQVLMFCSVMPLISKGRMQMIREPGKPGVWLSTTGKRHLQWIPLPGLANLMCKSLLQAELDPCQLASVCSRVFQNRSVVAVDPEDGSEGIRIQTGMENFVCRQCGRCCRSLDYRKDLTPEDVSRWIDSDRKDILKWVGRVRQSDHSSRYRMWVKPGTDCYVETCPFLKRMPSGGRWGCAIHAVKPDICRQYPMSRKHALMTGCRGFESRRRSPEMTGPHM